MSKGHITRTSSREVVGQLKWRLCADKKKNRTNTTNHSQNGNAVTIKNDLFRNRFVFFLCFLSLLLNSIMQLETLKLCSFYKRCVDQYRFYMDEDEHIVTRDCYVVTFVICMRKFLRWPKVAINIFARSSSRHTREIPFACPKKKTEKLESAFCGDSEEIQITAT